MCRRDKGESRLGPGKKYACMYTHIILLNKVGRVTRRWRRTCLAAPSLESKILKYCHRVIGVLSLSHHLLSPLPACWLFSGVPHTGQCRDKTVTLCEMSFDKHKNDSFKFLLHLAADLAFLSDCADRQKKRKVNVPKLLGKWFLLDDLFSQDFSRAQGD